MLLFPSTQLCLQLPRSQPRTRNRDRKSLKLLEGPSCLLPVDPIRFKIMSQFPQASHCPERTTLCLTFPWNYTTPSSTSLTPSTASALVLPTRISTKFTDDFTELFPCPVVTLVPTTGSGHGVVQALSSIDMSVKQGRMPPRRCGSRDKFTVESAASLDVNSTVT